jgi:hypothetical protein
MTHRSLTPHTVVLSVKFVKHPRSLTAPSATVEESTPSDRCGSITNRWDRIPRLCSIHRYDLRRTHSFAKGVSYAEDQTLL